MGTIIHDPARNTISADSESLRLNTTGGEALRVTAADDAVNVLEIKSAGAGNKISVNAIGTDTDIDIDLIPKGAGVLTIDGAGVSVDTHTHTVEDLSNTNVGGVTDGQTLTYDSGTSKWINATPVAGVTDHTLLSNIGTNTHANIDTHIGDVANPHGDTVDNLDDTVITAVADAEVLTYDSGTSKWINAAAGGGGGNNWLTANNGADFTTAPTASASNAISIGNGATSNITGVNNITIGNGAGVGNGNATNMVVIGTDTVCTLNNNLGGVVIGYKSTNKGFGVACGSRVSAAEEGVSIGSSINTIGSSGRGAVGIGNSAGSSGNFAVAIGAGASVPSLRGIAIGNNSAATASNTIAIGTGILAGSTNVMKLGTSNGNAITYDATGKLTLAGSSTQFVAPTYTVATLPVGAAGGMIYVSDETGGSTIAFYDGTNWRRMSDRAIVA